MVNDTWPCIGWHSQWVQIHPRAIHLEVNVFLCDCVRYYY